MQFCLPKVLEGEGENRQKFCKYVLSDLKWFLKKIYDYMNCPLFWIRQWKHGKHPSSPRSHICFLSGLSSYQSPTQSDQKRIRGNSDISIKSFNQRAGWRVHPEVEDPRWPGVTTRPGGQGTSAAVPYQEDYSSKNEGLREIRLTIQNKTPDTPLSSDRYRRKLTWKWCLQSIMSYINAQPIITIDVSRVNGIIT